MDQSGLGSGFVGEPQICSLYLSIVWHGRFSGPGIAGMASSAFVTRGRSGWMTDGNANGISNSYDREDRREYGGLVESEVDTASRREKTSIGTLLSLDADL